VPIRLSPIPTTSEVLPLFRAKFGVDRGVEVASDVEKRAHHVLGIQ
jgi:hypothetical protein